MRFVAVDGASAEQRYALEPVTEASPEKIFERRWALSVLDQVLAHLRDEIYAGRLTAINCLILPSSGTDSNVLVRLTEISASEFLKGLAEYRRGSFASAAKRMQEVVSRENTLPERGSSLPGLEHGAAPTTTNQVPANLPQRFYRVRQLP